MVNASLPLVSLLVVQVVMMIWNASFYGDETVGEEFNHIQEPDSFVNVLEFLSDTAVAVGKTIWAFMTVPGSEHLPQSLQTPVRIIFGLVFGLAVLAALISLL